MQYFYATIFALGLVVSSFGGAQSAQAAGLTEAQVNSVVALVASFGADQQTVRRVENSLRGRGSDMGSSTASTSPMHNKDRDEDKSHVGKGNSCFGLTRNLRPGNTDATAAGEVSRLQKFLIEQGHFPEALVTGYFGSATGRALMRWQMQQRMTNVASSTGVGPMTREMMRKGCPMNGLTPRPISTTTSTTTQ